VEKGYQKDYEALAFFFAGTIERGRLTDVFNDPEPGGFSVLQVAVRL